MSQQERWRDGSSRMKDSQAEVRTGGSPSPKGTHAAVGGHGVPLGTGSEAMPKVFWPERRAENQRSYHTPAPIPSAWFHRFPPSHPQQPSAAPRGCHPVPSQAPALLGILPARAPSGTRGLRRRLAALRTSCAVSTAAPDTVIAIRKQSQPCTPPQSTRHRPQHGEKVPGW